jgi:LmbE family N-acetylglucosaminyl deacetylase
VEAPLLQVGLDSLRQSPTVLCVGAHCDDIEIGCGATLVRLVREFPDLHIVWAVFAGSLERESESRRAAAELLQGAASVELRYLGFRESYFPREYEGIKDAFETLKKQVQPGLILTHRLEDRHQDHRSLSELTWNTFRSHLVLEYEIAKYEGDLGHPNFYVSASCADLDRKVDVLMRCFSSQAHRAWFTPDTFRALARIRGIESAAPDGFAEAFHARKMLF